MEVEGGHREGGVGIRRQVARSGRRQEVWWQGGVACAEETSDAGESKVEDGEVESVVAALVPFGVNLV